ncbi:restriction endonuclease [Macrococcoides bohemicum]|uniref:Sau3AI family type II restriction endonuclease n=1 Tax=Macrococcoides bohemicum TaxID=1903056 RepID=UPI001C5DD0F6|nr:Sau3AI family type II restriction endonuclease [Macrococcus bohemicus]QYA44246.1 restriction endonuclease [Macrococcus bohemicus]
MEKFVYETSDELIMYAKEAEGKYLYEIDKNNMLANTNIKGSVGHIIESSYFGYEINSNAEPDFADVGIELKVTGILKMKNGNLKAKERLVLNIINYFEEANADFETSSFWKKNRHLLLFFYEYKKDANNKMDRPNTQIIKVEDFQFPEEDLETIKQDWYIIHNKILNGEAHLLSEGDTLILGACTKGSTAKKSLRKQPFSEEPAKQRAFSIKQGYMSNLVRKLITNEHFESITTPQEINKKSIEEILDDKFKSFYGKTDTQIADELNIILSIGKGRIPQLVSSMIGIKGNNLNKIEEFEKYNIKFKTININTKGKLKEHMSFENIKFDEYISTEWDESSLKEKFESTKWLFIVFKEDEKEKKVFQGFKLWNMPMSDIEGPLQEFYFETQKTLNKGVTLVKTSRGVSNNLPGAKDNPICHMRPKGRNADDKVKLPDGQKITKQCFWLNKEYIVKIISEKI